MVGGGSRFVESTRHRQPSPSLRLEESIKTLLLPWILALSQSK